MLKLLKNLPKIFKLTCQQQVVAAVFKKEQLRNVDGSDSLHPNRSGDVVVVLRPPYQFDAATFGQIIAFSQFFGQHGYLPDAVSLKDGTNMHAAFVAAGPGIRKRATLVGVRAVDLAPTLSFLMGFPGPINASGKILYSLLQSPGLYKEATILSIADPRAADAPDADGGYARPIVRDRRGGLPQAVVRSVSRRGRGAIPARGFSKTIRTAR